MVRLLHAQPGNILFRLSTTCVQPCKTGSQLGGSLHTSFPASRGNAHDSTRAMQKMGVSSTAGHFKRVPLEVAFEEARWLDFLWCKLLSINSGLFTFCITLSFCRVPGGIAAVLPTYPSALPILPVTVPGPVELRSDELVSHARVATRLASVAADPAVPLQWREPISAHRSSVVFSAHNQACTSYWDVRISGAVPPIQLSTEVIFVICH